jgi:hypothetical protein
MRRRCSRELTATNPNKQELLARLARHPEILALEVERAIAESISKDQG